MSLNDSPRIARLDELDGQIADLPITRLVDDIYESSPAAVRSTILSQLVAKVFEVAPPHERTRMLEQLLMPLGVLSLVAVANGIFAKIRFRSGWPDTRVGLEDSQNVQTSDVIALVNHVQQVSDHAVNGLVQLLAASPVLAGSPAAALLIKILLQRARSGRASDDDLSP